MATYPAAIASFRALLNKIGIVYSALKTRIFFAEDANNMAAEIVAIETELGTNPKGGYADVKARLDAIPAVPVKATGAEINTGTDDAKFATPKAIADSNIAFLTDIPSVPVKATGEEISTGTNDTKFATPKAIYDSDVVKTTKAQTLTSKRIVPRIGTTTDSATPTPSADDHDMYTVTALAQAATFGAPTGTPANGQKLIIRILDNGTARALAWNAIFRAGSDIALPTTSVLSKTLYCGFIYNSAATKWDLVAVTNNI